MSPDRRPAGRSTVDSDMFSLGVVLYELIAGATPFPGATAVRYSEALLLHEAPALNSLLDDPRIPPSRASSEGCSKKLPPRGYGTILRAVERALAGAQRGDPATGSMADTGPHAPCRHRAFATSPPMPKMTGRYRVFQTIIADLSGFEVSTSFGVDACTD